LMGGATPLAVSAHLGVQSGSNVDDVADLRIEFSDGRLGNIHLSWRSPVRRTSALIYGEQAMLEIEGDRVLLTPRSGATEDHSVTDMPDDSYHAAWFAGMAAEVERAIAEGPDGPTMRENLGEVRSALALTEGARDSATTGARIILNGREP
jgi:predicted dehydrogenase